MREVLLQMASMYTNLVMRADLPASKRGVKVMNTLLIVYVVPPMKAQHRRIPERISLWGDRWFPQKSFTARVDGARTSEVRVLLTQSQNATGPPFWRQRVSHCAACKWEYPHTLCIARKLNGQFCSSCTYRNVMFALGWGYDVQDPRDLLDLYRHSVTWSLVGYLELRNTILALTDCFHTQRSGLELNNTMSGSPLQPTTE